MSDARRVAIVSDAWRPQINGVVRTLEAMRDQLVNLGHRVDVFGPDRFRTVACPTCPEIRLSIRPYPRLAGMLTRLRPDSIHIATEGPLGWAARAFCMRRDLPFSTSFHTRFPDYLRARLPIPTDWTWELLRRFHAPASAVMAAAPSLRRELAARGFANVRPWSRGVDVELFRPRRKREVHGSRRPIFLNVGRVAVEKNLTAFLDLDLPGTKWVVGDGPLLAKFRGRYPDVRFFGAQQSEALAALYAEADAFVFPSRTDTFGLVMLEALACGVPVAAFPSPGPLDAAGDPKVGALGEDLRAAALAALRLDPADCRAYAERLSWRRTAEQFFSHLALVPPIAWPYSPTAMETDVVPRTAT